MRSSFRQAWRAAKRSRVASALAIVTLAIAISLNTAAYGLVDAALFPHTTARQPDQLFALFFRGSSVGRIDQRAVAKSIPFIEDAASQAVPAMHGPINVVRRGEHVRAANVVEVDSNYFSLLGAPPLLGRLLQQTDRRTSPVPVVVSRRFWSEFFGDVSAPGTVMLLIDDEPHQVVGVASDRGVMPLPRVDVWKPRPQTKDAPISILLVRVGDGFSVGARSEYLHTLSDRIARDLGLFAGDIRIELLPLFGGFWRVWELHVALLVAVSAILAIAVLNVSNLQLARGLQRTRELATRIALGASRRHIVGLLIADGLLLCIAGFGLACVVGYWLVEALGVVLPPEIADVIGTPQLSWRVFTVNAALTLVAAIVVSVVPGLRLSESTFGVRMKGGKHGRSLSSLGLHRFILTLASAAALTVISTAGLALRAVQAITTTDLGYDANRLAHASIYFKVSDTSVSFAPMLRRIRERLQGAKGLESVTVYFFGAPHKGEINILDHDRAIHHAASGFTYVVTDASFFRTLGIPILQGHGFGADVGEAIAMVDEEMAVACWGAATPVGSYAKLGASSSSAPTVRIVGVSRTFSIRPIAGSFFDGGSGACPTGNLLVVLREQDLKASARVAFGVQVVARSVTSAAASTMMLRFLRDLGAGVLVGNVSSMEDNVGIGPIRSRYEFAAIVFSLLSLAALSLAATGLFTVTYYMTAQRLPEIGIRLALGARRRDIVSMVLGDMRLVILTGLALGLLMTLWTSRLLETLLLTPGSHNDPVALLIGCLVLLFSQILAALLPALWAARTNPASVLQVDSAN